MDQNPVHTKGNRNVFCPFYKDCLNHAAKHYWGYWACLECRHKQKYNLVTEVLLSQRDDYPYYSISTSLNKKMNNIL